MKFNTIIEGDSLQVLKELQANSIDIIITSPPYNAAHNYDNYDDNKDFNNYLKNMKAIFCETYRVLRKGGRICVNVPFAIKNKKTKKVTFIAHHIASILNEIGYIDFEWITWHKGKNMNHFQGNNTAWGSWKSPSCPSFRPLGEAVLVFYKEEKRHVGSSNKIDITGEEFKDWTKNTWYFNELDNNVYENLICVSNDAKKKEHPAPFPTELVERLLKLYSYQDEIVLDPFNGIGTTTLAAEQTNRKFIGIDLSKKYCDIACSRLKNEYTHLVFDSKASCLVNSSANEGTLNMVFPYKESFSPNLVEYLINRYKVKKYDSLMDPFLGTGSVFTNKFINKCYGYDTSLLAINISKAKLTKLTAKDYVKAKKIINSFGKEKVKDYKYPNWEPYKKYAPKQKYNIVMSLINEFSSDDLGLFIKFVIISNLDKVFDYKRDGNGIKSRLSKIPLEDTIPFLKELLLEALKLKKAFDKENNKIIDFRNESSVTASPTSKVDLVVTSPPYANMFDYFEVYKMELWTSLIVDSYDSWKQMKKSALRSNKNADIKKEEVIDNDILKIACKNMKKNNVNSSTISMVNNYFYDMNKVLNNMFKILNKNGYMFIVVGNSFYGGVPIKTDEIISSLAQKIGFEVVEMIIARKLSTSSQQMKLITEEDKFYLRESIIVLRKGD